MTQKSTKKEAVFYLFKKYFQYSGDQKTWIIFFILLSTISQLVMLAGPVLFGRMLTEIQFNGVSTKNIYVVCVFMGLLLIKDLVFWVFHGPSRVIERIVAFKIESFYRKYLLEGVLKKNSLWHNAHDSGDTINKIQKATDGLKNFSENIYQIVQTVIRLMGTGLVLYFYSPVVSIVVLSLSFMTLSLIYFFDKKLLPQYSALNEYSNKASASLFDSLSNITTVKILNIESVIGQGVLARFWAAFRVFCANVKLNEWKWFYINNSFQFVSIVPLACFLIYKIMHHEVIDIGQVSTLYLYLSELIFVFFGFGGFYEQMCIYRNGVMNAESIEVEIQEDQAVDKEKIEFSSSLEIKNLGFSYEDKNQSSSKALILKNINLTVRKGQKIAIIGESGSGKTTLLKAIHGLFSTATASILVDQNLLSETKLSSLDLSTMLVPQEPEVFSATIRENLTLGIEYPDDEIQNALEVSRFLPVLEHLPLGLDSVMNEKGVNLSGGQKQRLALSRAILFAKHKEIILLDESTSSVDSENEMAIYDNIFSLFKTKTVIASIHKMNLLKLFDYIVIIGENSILDEGTFDELLIRNKEFKKLWEQFIKADQTVSNKN